MGIFRRFTDRLAGRPVSAPVPPPLPNADGFAAKATAFGGTSWGQLWMSGTEAQYVAGGTFPDSMMGWRLAGAMPWAASCIDARANAVSQAPLKLYRRDKGTSSKDAEDAADEVAEHPVLDLLRDANPIVQYGPTFRGACERQLSIYGQFMVLKARGTAEPKELHMISAEMLDLIRDKDGYITGYYHRPSGTIYQPRDIVRHHYARDDMPVLSRSPTSAAIQAINRYIMADVSQTAIDRRGGQGGGVIAVDFNALQTDVERFKTEWDAFRSDPSNAGRDAFMPPGTSYSAGVLTAQQMQREERAGRLKREIFSAYGVPPSMAGDYTDASVLANADQQAKNFWQLWVVPECDGLADTFNRQLLWAEWPDSRADGLFLAHDYSDIYALQPDETMVATTRGTKATFAVSLYGAKIASLNEVRKIVDLPELDDPSADEIDTSQQPKGPEGGPAQAAGQDVGPDGKPLPPGVPGQKVDPEGNPLPPGVPGQKVDVEGNPIPVGGGQDVGPDGKPLPPGVPGQKVDAKGKPLPPGVPGFKVTAEGDPVVVAKPPMFGQKPGMPPGAGEGQAAADDAQPQAKVTPDGKPLPPEGKVGPDGKPLPPQAEVGPDGKPLPPGVPGQAPARKPGKLNTRTQILDESKAQAVEEAASAEEPAPGEEPPPEDQAQGEEPAPEGEGPPWQKRGKVRATKDASTNKAAAGAPAKSPPWAFQKGRAAKADDSAGHTGAMIALTLPAALASRLVLDSGALPTGSEVVSADEMHVTLAYLGEAAAFGPAERRAVELAVREVLGRTQVPLAFTVKGGGWFAGDGDMIPIWAGVAAAGLAGLRDDLVRTLAWAGVSIADDHGDWRPHITLAYVPVGRRVSMPEVPELRAYADGITVVWAGVSTLMPLSLFEDSPAQMRVNRVAAKTIMPIVDYVGLTALDADDNPLGEIEKIHRFGEFGGLTATKSAPVVIVSGVPYRAADLRVLAPGEDAVTLA